MSNKSQANALNVQVFNNPAFGEIRTVMCASNEPLFCLVDLCEILALNPSKVSQRLNDDVLSKHSIPDSLGRQQLSNFVNEDGLYDVILDSRKPEARKFRKWVTSEVLPSIRKDGGYMLSQPEETPEEIMAKALMIAQRTIESQRIRAEYEAARAAKLESENKALAPKAEYTDQVLLSNSTFTFTQVAIDLGLRSVHVLTAILKEEGIIYRQSGQWLPTAKVTEKGYFATRSYPYPKSDGTIGTSLSTVITERGRMFLHGLVNGKGGAK